MKKAEVTREHRERAHMALSVGRPAEPGWPSATWIETGCGLAHVDQAPRDAVAQAIADAEARGEARAWVPCKERMPKPGVDVNVVDARTRTVTVRHLLAGSPSEWSGWELGEISHWCQLPKLPVDT